MKQGGKDTRLEVQTNMKANWGKFKSMTESVIKKNESQIKELRRKIAKSGQKEHERPTKKLVVLELKNKELKEKLAERAKEFRENFIEFNETGKKRQRKFKKKLY